MTNVVNKIKDGNPVDESDVGFSSTMKTRKRRKLDKDRLQVEEEENENLMERKMYFDQSSEKWNCRDCPWKGQYRHKAKGHARDCGRRRRVAKKSTAKKFSCSSADCGLSFNLRSKLMKHYR